MNVRSVFLAAVLLLSGFAAPCTTQAETESGRRATISLDGLWEVGEGTMTAPPQTFEHRVPVPGLIDLAQPGFAETGVKNQPREAFWYRTTFRIDGSVPEVALIKIYRALYSAKVFLNGTEVGEHISVATPGEFPVENVLKGNGAENEILIRVGAYLDAIPPAYPDGYDFEVERYFAGLYDSVELILGGRPFIRNVQIAPDIEKNEARVEVELDGVAPGDSVSLTCRLTVAATGQPVSEQSIAAQVTQDGGRTKSGFSVSVPNARLWSPEDPFLYNLEIITSGDRCKTRFGMREFRFDPKTGKALLNGKPCYLRGTNVVLPRFLEDSERGNLPWDETWVRGLHEQFKKMGWNSARYCIGFPPEIWYRIADETGIMIQDEYPLWFRPKYEWKKEAVTVEILAEEYTRWMRERWNHPSVVIWDTQNETQRYDKTGTALQQVRHLDLSGRPWDNGWGEQMDPGDANEIHKYLFQPFKVNKVTGPVDHPPFRLADLQSQDGLPDNAGKSPANMILNEYGWLWLSRDGTPTLLTQGIYQPGNIPFAVETAEDRRYAYARLLAAETEYWRCHRKLAGVLHFCALAHSKPKLQTSDHFIDVKNLKLEPNFADFVGDAFSPVGLMVNEWAETLPPGPRKIEVYVINDTGSEWSGDVTLSLLRDGKVINQTSQSAAIEPAGRTVLTMEPVIPAEPGTYQLEAALTAPERGKVRSLRDFHVRN